MILIPADDTEGLSFENSCSQHGFARSVSGGGELDSVETPRGQIVRANPKLVYALAEVVRETFVRGEFEKEKKLARTLFDIALNIYRRSEHPVGNSDVKAALCLSGKRMTTANVIDDCEWNTGRGLGSL